MKEFHPNWKLTSLPQEIQVSINDDYAKRPSPQHIYDDVYFENETGKSYLAVGEAIAGADTEGRVMGEVVSPLFPTNSGFSKIEQGFYDTPAWRNFNKTEEFTGSWNVDTYSYVNTGNFEGQLMDNMSYYPLDADAYPQPGTSGTAHVALSIGEYSNLNNSTVYAQVVEVFSYTGDGTATMGVTVDTIGLPTGTSPVIGVIEGTIQIEKGPGVWVSIHETGADHSYYLHGKDYREPGSFGIASIIEQDRTVASTGVHVSFAVDQRSTHISGYDADRWNDWESTIKNRETDKFIIYNVTGYLGDHSYLNYSGVSGLYNRTTSLDDTLTIHTGASFSTFDGITYEEIPGDVFIFETQVRPYGITGSDSTSGLLFSCSNPAHNGTSSLGKTELWLHQDGHLEGFTELSTSYGAFGKTNALPALTLKDTYTTGGFPTEFAIDGSNGEKIIWGQWNHIGFAMEQLVMGDTMSGANQPLLLGDGEQLTHGSRSSKVYITVNGNVAASIETGPDTYDNRMEMSVSGVGPIPYSSDNNAAHAWPTINMLGIAVDIVTVADKDLIIGRDIVADFDHTRFGIRDRVDVYSDLIIKGAKSHAPTFIPSDALKPSEPNTGEFHHMEFAHVYRFDYGTDYPFWDEGYSPTHIHIEDVPLSDGMIDGYDLRRRDFITEVDGPKGRKAVRVGPGANLSIPLSRWDERAYNGTGSYSLDTAVRAYSNAHVTAASLLNDTYEKTNSNSDFVFAAHIELYKYPESGRITDLFTLDENPTDAEYGDSQVYIGVDYIGNLICGTRRAYIDNGTKQIGPLTGGNIPLNTWTHIGFGSKLHRDGYGLGTPIMETYIGGIGDLSQILSIPDTVGGAGGTSGAPFAMSKSLASHGTARVGGIGPVGVTDRSWRDDYSDFSISEMLFGYRFQTGNSQIDFARLATTSGVEIVGHYDKALVGFNSVIGEVKGTGDSQGVGQFT